MKRLLLAIAIASFFFSGCKKGNEIKRKKQYTTDTVASIKMKQTWFNLKDGYAITFDSVLFDGRDMTGATSGWAKADFRFNDGITVYSFFLLSPPSHSYYDTIIGPYKIYFKQLLPDPTVGDSIPNNPDEYVAKLEIMYTNYQ